MLSKLMISNVNKNKKNRRFKNGKRLFLKNLLTATKIITTALAVCFTIYGTYYLFVKSTVFKVQNFDIIGTKNFVNKSDVLIQLKDSAEAQNILKLNTILLEQALKNTFLGARDFKVSKQLPDTLLIQVEERVPLALLKTKNTNDDFEYYLVDAEGYILGLVDPKTTNLPIINYEESITVGIFIDRNLVPLYINLISSSDIAQIKISSVSVHDKHITFFIDNTIEVLLGKNKDTSEMIFVLKELIKQLSIEGRNVKKIDLRYDKVVVE